MCHKTQVNQNTVNFQDSYQLKKKVHHVAANKIKLKKGRGDLELQTVI